MHMHMHRCVANELVVRVQPEEQIYWKVQNKVPGLKFEVEQVRHGHVQATIAYFARLMDQSLSPFTCGGPHSQVRMDLFYAQSYLARHVPAAYERLLLEVCMRVCTHRYIPGCARTHRHTYCSHTYTQTCIRPPPLGACGRPLAFRLQGGARYLHTH